MTLLVRFAPRQRQKPMNELLTQISAAPEVDLIGSLIDGDMAAYYNWVNQQRLPGADQRSFWFGLRGIARRSRLGRQCHVALNLNRQRVWTSCSPGPRNHDF